MMKIKLKNIKSRGSFETEIPDQGLTMIKGPSGAGKSTILESIYEALWADGEDMVSWGVSKSSITIDWLGHLIERTKGPSKLFVKTPEAMETIDDVAQGVITNLLGMNLDEFRASAYIRQGFQGSLLSLKPVDQLRLIQRLSSGSSDPSALRKKIVSEVNTLSGRLDVLLEREEGLAKEVLAATDALNSLQAPIAPPALGFDFTEIKQQKQQVETELAEARLARQKNTTELESVRAKITNHKLKLAALQQQSKDLKAAQNRLTAEILAQAEQTKELSGLISKMPTKALLQDCIKRAQGLTKISEISAKIDTIHTGRPDNTRPSEWAQLKITELNTAQEVGEHALAALKKTLADLRGLKQPQHCPDCNAPLQVIDGAISRSKDLPPDYQAQLTATQDQITATIQRLAATKDLINSTKDLLSRAKQIIGDLPQPTEDHQNPTETLANLEKTELALQLSQAKEQTLQADLARANTTFSMAITEIATMGDTGSTSLETAQQDLEGVIAKFSNRINELEEKLKFFSEYYDKYIKHSELVRVYELGLAEQTRRRQALEKAMAGKTEHDQQISAAKSQVWAAKRLLEINDKAATDSIDATIDQINSYAQPILDKFFPDEGTTVRILNGVTTGSGEHRDKLGIEVWHKGKKAKKLSSLSFGEQSRVLMAFQLALAEMYKSPILMVDEGFTGVDLETKDECLGILKEFSSDRMILVVEHGASEYLFDHVIRIEGGIND